MGALLNFPTLSAYRFDLGNAYFVAQARRCRFPDAVHESPKHSHAPALTARAMAPEPDLACRRRSGKASVTSSDRHSAAIVRPDI